MPQGNWKTLALLGCVAALASVLLILSLLQSSRPVAGWSGLAAAGRPVCVESAASRFTVSVTSADGVSQSEKWSPTLTSS